MTRPRIHICVLTAFSLLAIAGLSVAVCQLWNEVVPLRSEVQLLRKQMGHLTIENSDLPHAIVVATDEPDTWRWRAYLPPLPFGKYLVNCTPGLFPPVTEENVDAILENLRRTMRNWTINRNDYSPLEGEVAVEAKLIDREGYRYLKVMPVGGQVIGVPDNWRSYEDKTSRLTGLNSDEQTVYFRGEPILLLCLQSKPRLVQDQFGREGPQLQCDTVLMWIHSVD